MSASTEVGAVIVSFNPGPNLLENCFSLTKQGAQVVIVDNGSEENCNALLDALSLIDNVQVMRLETNTGLARALNTGINQLDPGVQTLFTFDQDSVADAAYIESMMKKWQELTSTGMQIGLLGPSYWDEHTQNILNRDLTNGDIERTILFTSGLLIPKAVYQTVGPFREDFFVDHVDSEFCLRCRKAGLKNIQTSAEVLRHNLGRMSEHKLFGRRIRTTNHGPDRRMSITKNRVSLWFEYGRADRKWLLGNELPSAAGDLVKILLFEDQKLAKLHAIFRGGTSALKSLAKGSTTTR